jgi:hypothetical protein
MGIIGGLGNRQERSQGQLTHGQAISALLSACPAPRRWDVPQGGGNGSWTESTTVSLLILVVLYCVHVAAPLPPLGVRTISRQGRRLRKLLPRDPRPSNLLPPVFSVCSLPSPVSKVARTRRYLFLHKGALQICMHSACGLWIAA